MTPEDTRQAVQQFRATKESASLSDRAARLLESAAHPRWNKIGTNGPGGGDIVAEDTKTADREAMIGLGLSMLDLAAALRGES